MAHQAHGGFVDDLVQDHEVLVLKTIFRALEVIEQVVFKLRSLLIDFRKVNEEPGAHVPLGVLHLLGTRRPVALAKQVAVLEKTSASNLLRIPRRDQFLVKMVEGLPEIPVHTFANDGRVEVLCDGRIGTTLVKEKKSVQHDVERVHGELVLPSHRVHKL